MPETAQITVNAVEFQWTSSAGWRFEECRGTCGHATRGRVLVRDVMRGRDRQEPWCLQCVMAEAIERGMQK